MPLSRSDVIVKTTFIKLFLAFAIKFDNTTVNISHLDIVVRVPIGVVDDDSVGSVQVDAETTGSGGQQEAELLSAFLVEAIDGVLESREIEYMLWPDQGCLVLSFHEYFSHVA